MTTWGRLYHTCEDLIMQKYPVGDICTLCNQLMAGPEARTPPAFFTELDAGSETYDALALT